MSKLSNKELKEVFYEIVEWVRAQGCKVYCHHNSKTVAGSNGYFTSEPKPHIRMGLKGRPWEKAIELVIHEFCHYWQWSDGFLGHKDDDGNIAYAKLLNGETLTPQERLKASTLVRISEYDCEKRTGHLFKLWNLEAAFPPEEHRKSAATYNRHIVWSIGDDKNEGSGIFLASYDKLGDALWGNKVHNRWLSVKELLAPISPQHKKIFDEALAKVKKKKTAA